MPTLHRVPVWTGRVIGLVVAVTLWGVSTTQSGYSIVELLVFAGPGIVLAIAANWAASAFSRDTWSWSDALRASGLGAVFLPPIIAAGIAFFSAWNTNAVVLTFILGAWLALAAGVLASRGIILSPAVGAVLMSVSTIIVAINAQLLRRVRL